MQFALPDGYNLNVEEVGSGFPLIVLHGGPGLDHSMFRPYLDPLGDEYRLLYVDERGQGRSQRVDPATLSLDVFARAVDLLAEPLALDADVAASLEALGDSGKAISQSWEDEKTVETDAQLMQLLRDQLPFHFHGEPPPGYVEQTVPSPEVLRHFANAGYGDFDYRPKLKNVDKPTLVIVGEYDLTTTPRAARVLHNGIPGSELHVVPDAGHLSFVEQPDDYLAAVRCFLGRTAK